MRVLRLRGGARRPQAADSISGGKVAKNIEIALTYRRVA